jgi:predicted oxidoreductase
MPLASLIDWDKHIIRILPGDESHWVQAIVQFHQHHSANEFRDLQQANRQLWQEKLTYNGFFAHFHLLPPNQSFAHLYA